MLIFLKAKFIKRKCLHRSQFMSADDVCAYLKDLNQCLWQKYCPSPCDGAGDDAPCDDDLCGGDNQTYLCDDDHCE